MAIASTHANEVGFRVGPTSIFASDRIGAYRTDLHPLLFRSPFPSHSLQGCGGDVLCC